MGRPLHFDTQPEISVAFAGTYYKYGSTAMIGSTHGVSQKRHSLAPGNSFKVHRPCCSRAARCNGTETPEHASHLQCQGTHRLSVASNPGQLLLVRLIAWSTVQNPPAPSMGSNAVNVAKRRNTFGDGDFRKRPV
jgi:hypothetical protein